uniref:Pentatricopeptide repeat-containing protein n=1 Tax=Quercus lobata TaxID=97700 RepID=A0A7N2QYN4_QUELO
MASLCKEGSLGQARGLFQELRNATHRPDVVSFTTIIDGALKAGDFQSAKELLMDMLGMGLASDYMTFSSLISRLSKLGQLDEAKSVFEKMIASGFTPDTFVYDSLLKGFASKGKTKEIIDLLPQMADKGVVLDSEIISTILTCLCDMFADANIDLQKCSINNLPVLLTKNSASSAVTLIVLPGIPSHAGPPITWLWARASLPGFQVFPLQQFGIWGPEITTKLDPQKDTYVMTAVSPWHAIITGCQVVADTGTTFSFVVIYCE